MTSLEAQNVIEGLLDSIDGVHTLFDNIEYTGEHLEWYRVHIRENPGKQISMGDGARFRHYGFVFVQIFVKPDTGSGRAMALADMITPILRAKRINGILFFVPSVEKIGSKDGWYQVNVVTEFYRED